MPDAFAHPALALIVGAAIVPVLCGRPRAAVALAVPLIALGLVFAGSDDVRWTARFAGVDVTPFVTDKLSRLFGTIFALMAFGGVLFGLNQPSRLELPAALLYAGAALGVTFAGDLLTVFIFWELMAIGSTLVIWSAATDSAYRASLRYLMVHLLGGTLLLLGVVGHHVETGSLAFRALEPSSAGYWLILAAFLINAGAPPLSAWLPDAYPEASWSGTVFLSGFTTKVAVFALMRAFPGTEALIWIGLYMAFYGIVYGLLENDMRRILAYTIVNQVGIMVTGIGIGTEMALNGAAASAFAGTLYKALLLMSAGSVLLMTGKRKCTDLGGLFRSMPVTTLCGIVGAMAIASVPLTSGFISKSMIGQAAAEAHWLSLWLLLVMAAAGVALQTGIKFPWFVFFHKDPGLRPPDPPLNMRIAMVLFAALSVGLGVFYAPLYRLLPYPVDYAPYSGWHVVAQLQLTLFSGLAFFAMLRFLKLTRTLTLDIDWLYRWLLPAVLSGVTRAWGVVSQAWRRDAGALGKRILEMVQRIHGPQGIFARTWPVRSMGLWMLGMLLGLLLIGYVG